MRIPRNTDAQAYMVSVITSAMVFAIGIGGLITYTVDGLRAATVRQCETRDWSAHQARAHEDFCKAYLAEHQS